ncbi:hypothetical protein ACEQPO_12340 [Bacillus sp. SL00103]
MEVAFWEERAPGENRTSKRYCMWVDGQKVNLKTRPYIGWNFYHPVQTKEYKSQALQLMRMDQMLKKAGSSGAFSPSPKEEGII